MIDRLYPLPGAEPLAAALADAIGCPLGASNQRRFPDGECYVRLLDDCDGKDIAIVARLDRPDDKFLSLLMLADTLRDLGAARIGLVAPYLPYMRQDARFQPGEGITSRYFARMLSAHVDWLVTVDPHLHRYDSLDEIYSIPSRVPTAAPLLAQWISANVGQPLLIGPDAESEQWVAAVADAAGAPYRVLEKIRNGDRDVSIAVPDLPPGRTPVLIDDIISTGHTMARTVQQLRRQDLPAPVCLATHALFADGAVETLRSAGAGAVVTTNSILHSTNGIDLVPVIAEAARALVRSMDA